MLATSRIRRSLVAVAALATALSLCCALAALAQDSNARGTLSGKVVDEEGEPLAGVEIRFLPLHNPEAETETLETDRKGRFMVGFFPAGAWRPEVGAEGWFVKSIEARGGAAVRKSEEEGPTAYFELRRGERVKVEIVAARSGAAASGGAGGDAAAEGSDADAGILAKPLEMLRAGDMAGLLATVEPVLEADPDQPTGHYLKGIALWRLGRVEESLAPLRRAVELMPDQAGVHGALGTALVDAGDARLGAGDEEAARAGFEEAVTELRAEAGIIDEPAPILTNLASVLMRLDRNDEAIETLQTVLQSHPNDAAALISLADLLMKSGRDDEAMAVIDRIDVDTEKAAAVVFNAAVGLINSKNFDSAITLLERAVEQQPESFFLHKGLARSYLAVGRQEDAVRELEETLRLAPEGEDVTLEKELLERWKKE